MPLQIVHQYLTLPKTILRPPGFGDFLRGTIALYQYTTNRQIPLYVAFDGHPVGNYLVETPHPPSTTPVVEMINSDPQKNPLSPPQLEMALDKYDLGNRTVSLCTNSFFREPLSEDCRQFMQAILTPNPSFQSKIDQVMDQVGLVTGQYNAIHLRSGDPSFMTQNLKTHHYNSLVLSRFKTELDKLVATETLVTNKSCVMIADNMWVKNRVVMETCGSWITSLDTTPTHLGSVVRSNQPTSHVEDTLIDFFVIAKSRHIYQFSVYNWGSGFSDICHHIYGQPITHTYLKL